MRAQTEHGEQSQEGQRPDRSRAFCHSGSLEHQRRLGRRDRVRDPRRGDAARPRRHRRITTSAPSTRGRAPTGRRFEPIEEPRPPRRAANDDRETIGQILQAIQKGRPARNVYTLATLFAGVWIVGAGAADRQLPALAAGRDRPGQRRHAGARRPCRVVLRAGAAVLFPGQPCLARPGTAHDRAVDGAGRDPLFRAGRRGQRLDGDRRPGDPPRSRGDGRRRRTRHRARRRTRNPGRQRSLRAGARLYRQRGAHPRAAAGYRPSARQPGRPGRAGPQRHLRRADRPAPRHRADLRRHRLARRRGRQRASPARWKSAAPTSPARSAMPATT